MLYLGHGGDLRGFLRLMNNLLDAAVESIEWLLEDADAAADGSADADGSEAAARSPGRRDYVVATKMLALHVYKNFRGHTLPES